MYSDTRLRLINDIAREDGWRLVANKVGRSWFASDDVLKSHRDIRIEKAIVERAVLKSDYAALEAFRWLKAFHPDEFASVLDRHSKEKTRLKSLAEPFFSPTDEMILINKVSSGDNWCIRYLPEGYGLGYYGQGIQGREEVHRKIWQSFFEEYDHYISAAALQFLRENDPVEFNRISAIFMEEKLDQTRKELGRSIEPNDQSIPSM